MMFLTRRSTSVVGLIVGWTACLLSFLPHAFAFQAPLISGRNVVVNAAGARPRTRNDADHSRTATTMTIRLGLVPLSTDSFPFMADVVRASQDDTSTTRLGPRIDNLGRVYLGPTEVGTETPNYYYVLSIVEQEELERVCAFIVRCFGADAIRLSSDVSPLERAILSPVVHVLNELSYVLAAAELYQGLRHRTPSSRHKGKNLPTKDASDPQQQIEITSQSSVLIALAEMDNRQERPVEVLAAVELRLQPCDAKIPFALPVLDALERKLGAVFVDSLGDHENRSLQPYLSNLCVDERLRGQGVGRALVRVVEAIGRHWGFSNVYLHVDEDNTSAYKLYVSEGYREVGRRWNPFWAGQAAQVGYLRKSM